MYIGNAEFVLSSLIESTMLRRNYITFIDIDDTVFKTSTDVLVKDEDGKTVKQLNSFDYNNYILRPGEYFDYSQFRNSEAFANTAKPMPSTLHKINRLLNIVRLKQGVDKIIFLTARADMDDKQLFLSTFRKAGIPVDNEDIIYIERAGNIKNMPTPEAKAYIIKKYLNTNRFNVVRMIDDSANNLDSFLDLKDDYPELKFIAIQVTPNGNLRGYR